jgi:hypothetical protein
VRPVRYRSSLSASRSGSSSSTGRRARSCSQRRSMEPFDSAS